MKNSMFIALCFYLGQSFMLHAQIETMPSIEMEVLEVFNPELLIESPNKKVTALVSGYPKPIDIEVTVREGVMYWQGDIEIPKENVISHGNVTYSNVISAPFGIGLWPSSTIPYDENSLSNFDNGVQRIILDAIGHINDNTNLCLVPRRNQRRFIRFEVTNDPNVCGTSPVGANFFNNINTVRYNPNALDFGCAVHELYHSLGVHHEHTRSDRDQFVEILVDNIIEDEAHNFDIPFFSKRIGAYDFSSIMHYVHNAFGRACNRGANCTDNQLRTIRPIRNLTAARNMGQRDGLSDGDIQGVNALYPQKSNACNPAIRNGLGIMDIRGARLELETMRRSGQKIGGWRIGDNDIIRESGDFNSDGIQDFVITSGWGIGILTYSNNRWRALMVKPNGTRFGGWNFNSKSNKIRAVGDFNGDGKDEIYITSGWGMAILELQGDSMNSIFIKSKGSQFGQWEYKGDAVDKVRGIGDFNGNRKDAILLVNDNACTILELDRGQLRPLTIANNGDRMGGWVFNGKTNKFRGVGDFDGNGREELIITSSWGIGLLKLNGNALTTLMLKPKGAKFGGWTYKGDEVDKIRGIGNFNGGDDDEILVMNGNRLCIWRFWSNSLDDLITIPNNTKMGEWRLNSSLDKIRGIGDIDNDRRDDIIISSSWGMGVLSIANGSLETITIKPFNQGLGDWMFQSKDRVKVVGALNRRDDIQILLQKK